MGVANHINVVGDKQISRIRSIHKCAAVPSGFGAASRFSLTSVKVHRRIVMENVFQNSNEQIVEYRVIVADADTCPILRVQPAFTVTSVNPIMIVFE